MGNMPAQALREAQIAIKEKQKEDIKRIALKTLERLEELKKQRVAIEEEIKFLRMDIDDLKEGRIDRIVERQTKDNKAKEASVVVVVKETVIERERPSSPWFWPYSYTWQWDGSVDSSGNPVPKTGVITCAAAKEATIGAYEVGGHIMHLR